MMNQPGDSIDEFVEFVEQLFLGHPKAREREGASEEEIAELVRIARFPLPELYLGYLRVFGRNDGPVQLFNGECGCSAPALLRVHHRRAHDEDPYFPENCVLIGTQGLPLARSLHYAGGKEPELVVSDFEHVAYPIASTFKIYLYQHTWARRWLHGTLMPRRKAPKEELAQAVSVADRLGFSGLWFSDQFCYSAEKPSAKLAAYAQDGWLEVAVVADDPNESRRLREEFKADLGLEGRIE